MVLENLECSGTETRLVDCPRISAETAADDDYSTTFYELQIARCDSLQPSYAFVACGNTSGPRAPRHPPPPPPNCKTIFTWSCCCGCVACSLTLCPTTMFELAC